MREFVNQNLSAMTPLTPLNPDEPCRYVRCNLVNRLVHPDSEIVECNISQNLFEARDETESDFMDDRGFAKQGEKLVDKGLGKLTVDRKAVSQAYSIGAGVKGEITAQQVGAVRMKMGLKEASLIGDK